MAILINSPGLVTTGTEGADEIRFITGGFTGNGSVVNSLAGNDTIFATDLVVVSAASIGSGPDINAGGGADSIYFDFSGSTTSATNLTIRGGAGRDTITISGGTGSIANLAGGDGGDLITLNGIATYSAIGGGAGFDTITVGSESQATLATGATLGLGAGNDVFTDISGSLRILTGAGVFGGGGSDTITLNALTNTGSFVNGDSTANGGGADSIAVTTVGAETIVRGKGGADSINVANLAVSGTIAGNAGGDIITVSGAISGGAINGGQGADSIVIDDANLSGVSVAINGGGGRDTIFFGDEVVSNAGVLINAGAGVDSITFSGTVSNGSDLGGLQLNSFSDSTLGGYDTVDLTGLAISSNATMDVVAGSAIGFAGSATSIGAIADIAPTVFASGAAITGSVTGGYMTFTGERSATLAVAAGYADAATRIADGASEGRSVLFTNGGNDFLFIQGGTAGTDDDALIMFNGVSGSTMAAGTITLKAD